MSIPMSRYVAITSGVGGGAGVRQRDLILRLFTDNELVAPASLVEFTDADSVGSYFGTASAEYMRAAWYFGFIGKMITAPRKIAFARWVDVAVAPKIWGSKTAKALGTYSAVAAGALKLTMGADTHEIDAINLTGCASLAAVATALQTAIRAAAGAQFANATVTYDATTNRFDLAGGVAAAATMAVLVPGTGTDLSPLLGWTAASGAIIANGSDVETLTACLSASAELSNNFASFAFIPNLNTAQVTEVATWNDTQNEMFMLCQRTDAASAAALSAALFNLSGAGLTLDPGIAGEYPALLPAAILAATDYSRKGSAQNYMFYQANLTPSVVKSTDADTYDPLRVNYYGQTQTGGQNLSFYQRGVLMGLATDATDMNVYANEIWLKDKAATAIMSLLLSLGKIPANASGRTALKAQLQSEVIAAALDNGVISVGKDLDNTQKLYIGNLTGDPLAWLQVQNRGFWLDVVMQSYVTTDGRTEWKAVYTLVYSKDDCIRKVEGTHALI